MLVHGHLLKTRLDELLGLLAVADNFCVREDRFQSLSQERHGNVVRVLYAVKRRSEQCMQDLSRLDNRFQFVRFDGGLQLRQKDRQELNVPSYGSAEVSRDMIHTRADEFVRPLPGVGLVEQLSHVNSDQELKFWNSVLVNIIVNFFNVEPESSVPFLNERWVDRTRHQNRFCSHLLLHRTLVRHPQRVLQSPPELVNFNRSELVRGTRFFDPRLQLLQRLQAVGLQRI